MHHATIRYNIHRAQHAAATIGHHMERVKSYLEPKRVAELKAALSTIEGILYQAERDADSLAKRTELRGYSL